MLFKLFTRCHRLSADGVKTARLILFVLILQSDDAEKLSQKHVLIFRSRKQTVVAALSQHKNVLTAQKLHTMKESFGMQVSAHWESCCSKVEGVILSFHLESP